jgi:hypothetical protein
MFMGARDLSILPGLVIEVLYETHFKQETEPMVSDRLLTRLTRNEAVLVLIDRRRKETGNPNLGWALEKKVLEIEIADLEAAIAAQESTEHAL